HGNQEESQEEKETLKQEQEANEGTRKASPKFLQRTVCKAPLSFRAKRGICSSAFNCESCAELARTPASPSRGIDSGRNRSCNRSQAWAQSFPRRRSRPHFLLSISLPAAAVHFGS